MSRLLDSYKVNSLSLEDIGALTWAEEPSYALSIRERWRFVEAGQVVYLAVRDHQGNILSVGGVSFCVSPDCGRIFALLTHPEFRSLGLGSCLIGALEEVAHSRLMRSVSIGVEDVNLRALSLYERLGYEMVGSGGAGSPVLELRKALRS